MRRTISARRPRRCRPCPIAPGLLALESRMLMAGDAISGNAISGYVFQDANNDGVRQPGEAVVPNVPIRLVDAQGKEVGSATTDASGFYRFDVDSSVNPEPTTLTETAQFPDSVTDWDKTQSLPQFDPSLGTLTSVDVINTGVLTTQPSVENLDAQPKTIGVAVSGQIVAVGPDGTSLAALPTVSQTFQATSFDGEDDFAGTSGHVFAASRPTDQRSATIAGAALARYIGTGSISYREFTRTDVSIAGSGNTDSSVTTTASATVQLVYHYIPSTSLKPGAYTIVQTETPAGLFDGKDSSGGVVAPNPPGTNILHVVLADQDLTENDFGKLPPASIAGRVFLDANNDGVLQASELPISGVTVTLTGTDDLGAGVSSTATTDASGRYAFADLRPGNYALAESQPPVFLDGKDAVGSAGGTLANDATTAIALASGVSGVNYDFAEILPSAILGSVYLQGNGTDVFVPGQVPIADVTLTLTGTDDLGASVSRTTTTAANGNYAFGDLRPGTYAVAEAQPVGFLNGVTTVGSAGGAAGSDVISAIALAPGVAGLSYNFGEATAAPSPGEPTGGGGTPGTTLPPPAPASLSGYVYFDINHNGLRDSVDYGVAHAVITLTGTDSSGRAVSQATTTDSHGFYAFAGLAPGTYTLTEANLSPFKHGKDTIGSQGGTTSPRQLNALPLAAGQSGVNNNFGELARPNCMLQTLSYRALHHLPLPSRLGPAIRYYLPDLFTTTRARSGR